MSTIKDVAKLANVSISTVSDILNGKLAASTQTRDNVFTAIKKLNYIPNVHARKIISKKSENILFLMSSVGKSILSNPFYSLVFEGVDLELKNHEYNLLFATVEDSGEGKTKLPKMVVENNIDGIILAGNFSGFFIDKLLKNKIPIVLVDNQHAGLDCVVSDNVSGVYQGMDYLHSLGHKRIGFISGPTSHSSFMERLDAYHTSVSKHSLAAEVSLVAIASDFNAHAAAARLINQPAPPTAIFVANDEMAIDAMKYIVKETSLKVPENISLIGFDNINFSDKIFPELTTINVFKKEMGISAVDRLIKKIANPELVQEKITLRTELIVRGSAGRPCIK